MNSKDPYDSMADPQFFWKYEEGTKFEPARFLTLTSEQREAFKSLVYLAVEKINDNTINQTQITYIFPSDMTAQSVDPLAVKCRDQLKLTISECIDLFGLIQHMCNRKVASLYDYLSKRTRITLMSLSRWFYKAQFAMFKKYWIPLFFFSDHEKSILGKILDKTVNQIKDLSMDETTSLKENLLNNQLGYLIYYLQTLPKDEFDLWVTQVGVNTKITLLNMSFGNINEMVKRFELSMINKRDASYREISDVTTYTDVNTLFFNLKNHSRHVLKVAAHWILKNPTPSHFSITPTSYVYCYKEQTTMMISQAQCNKMLRNFQHLPSAAIQRLIDLLEFKREKYFDIHLRPERVYCNEVENWFKHNDIYEDHKSILNDMCRISNHNNSNIETEVKKVIDNVTANEQNVYHLTLHETVRLDIGKNEGSLFTTQIKKLLREGKLIDIYDDTKTPKLVREESTYTQLYKEIFGFVVNDREQVIPGELYNDSVDIERNPELYYTGIGRLTIDDNRMWM